MELTKSTLQELAQYLNISTKYTYYEFPDGWLSTCTPEPPKGGIFKNVENGAHGTFVDKYKKSHECIITGFHFEKHMNEIYLTVTSTDYTISSIDNTTKSYSNYMIDISSFKMLSGVFPAIPEKPKYLNLSKINNI